MNIQQQIISLQHIAINAKELKKQYPDDDAIEAMISQSQFMIKKLNQQQANELQNQMSNERTIRVERFRDGGSANFYLMPQDVKIASFDMYNCRPNKIATCLLSGRAEEANEVFYGWILIHHFIKESVGIFLDANGDFSGYVPNFKQKYIVNSKQK